ncbi:DUF2197 domain-containing protein [Desmospora activa]|uniref:Uncharacterized protein DUF2197 n=1 Tax=Desmospora activa DSM 45169 TaxID=1121389 RepID=A0A2T4ZBK9_9BACL|nr:uncharacterized protein DUF2197 [Desmospora activa DSM 45169]
MNTTCILCDQSFTPHPQQQKKLRKHPHRLFLCPDCHRRITERLRSNQPHQSKEE